MQQTKTASRHTEYDAAKIAYRIVDLAVDKKASDVTLLDVQDITTLAEYFVIATGTSDRQIRAISSGIQDGVDDAETQLLRHEGMPEDGWVLLDYGQIVVHIFAPEQRAYYDLERRWNDAPTLLKIQ